MGLIVQVGVIALMAAIGYSFGEQYYGETGMNLGAFIGAVFGLLVVSCLRASSVGR